ncbi:MAG: SOS response-associated peptidase [Rubrobacter sp.]|nr:SOS response-associated peptidase [Rubrobacter sp.]
MCGRYTLVTPVEELAERFGVEGRLPELPPSYNVAPGRGVAAVVAEGGRRRLEVLRWGLVPPWADDPSIGDRMINARAETVASKPSFRRAFRERRCLIPADGFYEWQRLDGGKQPYYVRRKDGAPFAFAGLWEIWRREGEEIRSCTILTTEANGLLGGIHDRMPVIVPPDLYGLWLEGGAEREELDAVLRPYPGDDLEAYPVSRLVNNPANDDPRCIEPAA